MTHSHGSMPMFFESIITVGKNAFPLFIIRLGYFTHIHLLWELYCPFCSRRDHWCVDIFCLEEREGERERMIFPFIHIHTHAHPRPLCVL